MNSETRPGSIRWLTYLVVPFVILVIFFAVRLWTRSDASELQGIDPDPATFVAEGRVSMQTAFEIPVLGAAGASDSVAVWVRLYEHERGTCVEVVCDGQRLLAIRGHRLVILDKPPLFGDDINFYPGRRDAFASDEAEQPKPAEVPSTVATDVNGDGVPEVLIAEWTGGMNCCLDVYICQILPSFRVQRIEAMHSEMGMFMQADDDPALEVRVGDASLWYWRTAGAHCSGIDYIMKFNGTAWEPSAELMRRPLPSEEELRGIEDAWAEWRREPNGDWIGEGTAPWFDMLDLVYSGHAAQAWSMLDRVWPGDAASKVEFRRDMLDHLRRGPAWKALVELNGASLDA